ncbi:MAG: hypothetical protein ABIH71_06340 [Candidatus Omnitrophota bacterium]|nr:hypothetical protein [Candidatus Omnitrophota bacterium]
MLKRILVLGIIISFLLGTTAIFAETIYTTDGEVIKAKISEKYEDIIWYEVSTEDDIVEYLGIDIAQVEKILNDDGSVSEYSPMIVPAEEEK